MSNGHVYSKSSDNSPEELDTDRPRVAASSNSSIREQGVLAGLIDENQRLLGVLRTEIKAILRERYVEEVAEFGPGTIGRHCRHIGEHYDALLGAFCENPVLDNGVQMLDYHSRKRCQQFETEPAFAIQRLEELSHALGRLRSFAIDTPIAMYCATGDRGAIVRTNLAREMDFLLAHTVHHGASIAMLMRRFGRFPDPRLWVAASTREAASYSVS